jgi:glycogen debranching enzyme
MGRLLSLATALLSIPVALSGGIPERRAVYIQCNQTMSGEDSAATSWLRNEGGWDVHVVPLNQLSRTALHADLVWVHAPDSASWTGIRAPSTQFAGLKSYYQSGGKLLLTGFAALLPPAIGIESVAPEVRPLDLVQDWLWDQKGIQGFRGHPVFDGLFGGVFTWDGYTDNRVHRIGYFGKNFPREGRVVGIEKSYVIIESDNKLMFEYGDAQSHAISIGAFVFFDRPNADARALRTFMGNTVAYLSGLKTGPTTYWVQADCRPRSFPVSSPARTDAPAPWRPEESGLHLQRGESKDGFYDLAGRRALVMGKEKGGIDELWVYPFRVVRDVRAGIVTGDSIAWLRNMPVTIDVRPESFTRTYVTPWGKLKEITFPSFEKPGAVIRYELPGDAAPMTMVISCRSDLRWMWPYDERALGDVYYGYDSSLGALHVRDVSGDFSCLVGGDRMPASLLEGQFGSIAYTGGSLHGEPTTANQVYFAAEYRVDPRRDTTFSVAIVGTDEGSDAAQRAYRQLLADPSGEYNALVRHYRTLTDRSVTFESPDSEFNALWRWALVGVDRFVATTPRLGTALLAGFSGVDRGWNGGHAVSGRPGYAWYFGRDAAWAGLAVDGYGDFDVVRKQLEFFQTYQDVTGKIFHEASTSGIVHYDAADATPLYVILAAHYLRASGDTGYLRAAWPHLILAMDYLYSTDTDGDLLIENTNIGHGWVEGGDLWPVHTEFYLAGIWAQALADAGWMAGLVRADSLASRYAADAQRVKEKIERDFWNPGTRYYSYGIRPNGSYNPEPTVLIASVLGFGWLDDGRATSVLGRLAGKRYAADWGVRMVSEESQKYNPGAYQYGAIWPLFTGHVALADYAYGREAQGFSRMLANMRIKNNWELGFAQEVMNGSVYRPSGICPHQCWSESNILDPGIRGMLGWSPLAAERRASLSPRFPLHWDHVSVRNLRVGDAIIDMQYEQSSGSTTYRLTRRGGSPVRIALAPAVSEGMTVTAIEVGGELRPFSAERRRGSLAQPVEFELGESVDVTVSHTGGIGAIPVMVRPAPGDSSVACALIGTSWDGGEYAVELEGKSGRTGELNLKVFDRGIARVHGGTLTGVSAEGIGTIRVVFPASRTRYSRVTVRVRLEELQR